MFYKLSDDWQELSSCTINQWPHERVLVLCCCKQQEGALSWWKWSLWAGSRYQDRRSHIRTAQYKISMSSKILNHLNNTTPDCLSEYHRMTCRCIYLLTLHIPVYFKSAETSTISYVIDSIGQYCYYWHFALVSWFKLNWASYSLLWQLRLIFSFRRPCVLCVPVSALSSRTFRCQL